MGNLRWNFSMSSLFDQIEREKNMNLQGICFRGTTRKISESCIQLTQFAYNRSNLEGMQHLLTERQTT
jgi:hypothetical protein